jgi:hypothetical protein
MACLICRDPERILDFRHSKYFEARSGAYYQVSTELAAYVLRISCGLVPTIVLTSSTLQS